MIVNPGKSQAIILDKRKSDHANERVNIDNEQMKVVWSVKRLDLQLNLTLVCTSVTFVNLLLAKWMH